MSNNKQSSSVEWLQAIELERDLTLADWNKAKAMREEELNVAYGNGYEQGEMDFYKKMKSQGKLYADGYEEGYVRALELVKWKIDNELKGGNNEQQ